MITSDIFPYEIPELHCHVRSDKDAFIFADRLADRLKELGMPGIAITDHGVVSSIEDYRHVLQGAGLKVIPGCELYIDGGKILGRQHGIVLAVDDEGWHGIGKIVTRANETRQGGYPVISADELKSFGKKYQGHIIFMTACMQGVISTIFLSNSKIDRLIEKDKEKQKKYLSPASEEYSFLKDKAARLDKDIDDLRQKRDNTKRLAEMKFASREKKIEKLEGDEKEKALKELSDDKKSSAEAAEKLDTVKNELAAKQRERTALNKKIREAEASVEKYDAVQRDIDSLNAGRLSEEDMKKTAAEELKSYVCAFGEGNVYAEVQYHGIAEEAVCFPKIAGLAREMGIPLAATNDVHMLTNSEDDILRRCLIRSLRFGKEFEEPSDADKELYLKTTDERIQWLSKILPDDMVKEALSNDIKIFERCNVEFKTSEHYPVASEHPKEDLEALVKKGIEWRFPDGFPDKEVYEARIKKELGVIEDMGYDNYHLVVREFLTYGTLLGKVPKKKIPEAPLDTEELKKWIAENGWSDNAGYRIGTGRGSDGGSLVCYLLGITNLDPIQHGLIFERFLCRERVSMPDIDSDISADTRQKVIDHCKYVYGEKAVCGIMTTNAQGPKGCIAIGSKFYGLRSRGQSLRALGDRMSKDVPKKPGTAFSTKVDRTTGKIDECSTDTMSLMEYLTDKWVKNNSNAAEREDCKEILHYASVMEGVFTSYGAHAAGIVIVKKGTDVSDVLPLMWNKKLGMMMTQCAKDDVEANGLLKFDFLGLKTLDIITEALQMIQKRTGKAIDVLKLDIADKKIYKDIFQTGRTKAVFQFESDGMRGMLKRFHPESFSDLVLLNAAYRPGPMQYLDDIIEVKNGRKEAEYLTPQLEPILKDTYGAMIYQEQVMQVCQSLAGYSFGEADQVRRAMSKKKKEKLAHEREAFINGDESRGIRGCVANGISADTANEIFDQMMKFASYAFNKSHAAAYAYNAYITAYLKEYYPAEFFAAALNWADKQEKINALIKEARSFGVEVKAPGINASEGDFSVSDGKIYFALSGVRGVSSYADVIVKERENGPFRSLYDLLVRCQTNTKAIENLIKGGAFDGFSDNRKTMLIQEQQYVPYVKKYKEKQSFVDSASYVLSVNDTLKSDTDVINAQTGKGFKAEIKKKSTSAALEQRISNAQNTLKEIREAIASVDAYASEDIDLRMKEEKEVLGTYVSATPIDGYPDGTEYGSVSLDSVDADTKTIYGYIEDVKIKKRKSDGAEMAFFTLTDRTGSIDCNCFTKSYRKYRGLISEGSVVVINGNMMLEENERSGDEEDEDDVKYKMSVYEILPVKKKQTTVLYPVKDFALFHIEKENDFRSLYESKSGHPLIIWDRTLDKMREMKYRVNDDILENNRVVELKN